MSWKLFSTLKRLNNFLFWWNTPPNAAILHLIITGQILFMFLGQQWPKILCCKLADTHTNIEKVVIKVFPENGVNISTTIECINAYFCLWVVRVKRTPTTFHWIFTYQCTWAMLTTLSVKKTNQQASSCKLNKCNPVQNQSKYKENVYMIVYWG